MTNEEIIADERYHTCGRCEWEDIPFICRQCKWGEDVRKDLWNLKEESKDYISREEAIDVLKNDIEICTIKQEQACDMAIKALEQTKWIPVSERLPDTDDEVLCWYKYYHWSREKVLPEYGLGRYLQNTQAWYGEVAQGKDVEVIAWMPLPEPYVGSDKDT